MTNVYILSKNIFCEDKTNVNSFTNIYENLIFSIIISEQWSYKTSFILLFLDIKKNTSKNFIAEFNDKTLKEIYDKNIKKFLYKNENLINLSYSDSRDDIFDNFLEEMNNLTV